MKRQQQKELPAPFAGWVANRNGLFSPEGQLYQPGDLRELHWLRQINADLRRQLREPQQFRLL